MQVKAETGTGKKKKKGTTDLLSFLEGSGWESGFPLSWELAFLTERETLSLTSCLAFGNASSPAQRPPRDPCPSPPPWVVPHDTRGFPWEGRSHHPLVLEVINQRGLFPRWIIPLGAPSLPVTSVMWWRGRSWEDTQGSGRVLWRRYQAEWWARMTPHDRSQHSRACGGLIFRERNISAVSRRIQMQNGQSAPSMRQTFSWTPEGLCSLSALSPPKWGAGGRERERETER